MTKTIPLFLFFLLLFAVKPVWAENSVTINNSSSSNTGNCSNHIKITTNGVTKEVNSTDCNADLSLSSNDSNPSSTANPTNSPTSHPSTSKPTFNPTAAPTNEPADSTSPSASPTASPSAAPEPTPDQQSWLDKVLDNLSKIVGSLFGG